MTFFVKVLTNYVPAVAVKRKGQALPGIIRRKALVGGFFCYFLNFKAQLY